jgi:hypothetical protein
MELDFVTILEQAAAFIGETVDNTWEALVLTVFSSRAEQYACKLSEFAQSVFRVVCEVTGVG